MTPADLESLAAEWEAEARQITSARCPGIHELGVAFALGRCADDLRSAAGLPPRPGAKIHDLTKEDS